MLLQCENCKAHTIISPKISSNPPLAESVISTCAIFAIDKVSQPPLSTLNMSNPAPWDTAHQWLVNTAPIEEVV